MQSKSHNANRLDPEQRGAPPNTVYSEPWWRSIGCNNIHPAVTGGNASTSSSLEYPNGGSESNDGQSQSNGGLNEEDDDANKEEQNTASPQAGGSFGLEHQNTQFIGSSIPSTRGECLTQPPQLELVGHSIACASNPYQDPYYGGMMAAYGHQPLGYTHYVGIPNARMPLHLEMAQEPVYVNAKQYQGILRRRQARAKAELEKKTIKVRKPYLHESRHLHAMRRARGTGGRFAKKTEAASNSTAEEKGTDANRAPSSQSLSSSGSELLPSDSAETWNSSANQPAKGSQVAEMCEAQNFISTNGHYQNHQNHSGFQAPAYHLQSGERGEDGDFLGQQHGSISSNQASHRPLAIQ